jgi:hypothetical protein
MSRSIVEIAKELREAIAIMANTHAEMASHTTGMPRIPGMPKIEVRLADGRTVELGALTDELLETASGEA